MANLAALVLRKLFGKGLGLLVLLNDSAASDLGRVNDLLLLNQVPQLPDAGDVLVNGRHSVRHLVVGDVGVQPGNQLVEGSLEVLVFELRQVSLVHVLP